MKELIRLLKDAGVVREGEFTFSSGIKSKYKIILDDAVCDFKILDEIVKKLLPSMSTCEVIVGQVSNGDTIAQELARHAGIEFRKYNKKDHSIYGAPIINKVCAGIDDVRTTGLSLVGMTEEIRNSGGIIKNVYTIVDWNLPQPSGQVPSELMKRFEINYTSLLQAQELL